MCIATGPKGWVGATGATGDRVAVENRTSSSAQRPCEGPVGKRLST